MIDYSLPTSITIDDKDYSIRDNGDYRVVLDVISLLNDNDVDNEEKIYGSLIIFYDCIPDNAETAVKEMFKFISCGEEEDENQPEQPKLMDWEKDFKLLVSPINRVLGEEVRALKYLHWYSFIAAYMEIGASECTFSSVVNIREKLKKHKKLMPHEQEFYNQNRKMIDLGNDLTNEEQDFIDKLLGGVNNGNGADCT